MGKNAKAEECTRCGELIYYNGNNPCCDDEPSEEEIKAYLEELTLKRKEAEEYQTWLSNPKYKRKKLKHGLLELRNFLKEVI